MAPPSPALSALLAATLDAPPELFPLLPALFQDLEDLGARAEDVVAVLRQARLPEGARVLDLGCGKGASAIALARELGLRVHGVDGVAPFVAHAAARAARQGVAERCTFEVGDLREVVRTARDRDVVMMLALGDVLGPLEQTVRALLGCVRPGGYVVLDDAYFDPTRLDDPGAIPDEFAGLPDRAASARLIEAAGARIVGERAADTAEAYAWLQEMTARVLARAEQLAAVYPELERPLREFAVRQCAETQDLLGPVVGVLWLLARR